MLRGLNPLKHSKVHNISNESKRSVVIPQRMAVCFREYAVFFQSGKGMFNPYSDFPLNWYLNKRGVILQGVLWKFQALILQANTIYFSNQSFSFDKLRTRPPVMLLSPLLRQGFVVHVHDFNFSDDGFKPFFETKSARKSAFWLNEDGSWTRMI